MNELISKKLIENLYNKFCTSPSNYNSIELDGKEYFIEDSAYSFIDGINLFYEKIMELPTVQQNCDSRMEVKQNLSTEWDYIDDVIESMPIITDPQPVIYAHWYAPTNDVPTEYCSNCNTPSQWWFDEKHCPNCGAKMREE